MSDFDGVRLAARLFRHGGLYRLIERISQEILGPMNLRCMLALTFCAFGAIAQGQESPIEKERLALE